MVTYSPSSASKQITISEMVYSTQLTLSIPATVAQNTGFMATGLLTFFGDGLYRPLAGKTISFTGGGISTTATTIADGTYSKTLYIASAGTFTVTASYAGETGLTAAEASSSVGVVGAADYSSLIWLGLLAAGVYIFRKELGIKI